MRADGYVVRRGTGEYYLPEEPEVRFRVPGEDSSLRGRIKTLARELWGQAGNSTRGTRDATVP